ncbi:MAG: SMC-Scp complex subunit ScpB [Anaeromyxobacter sp.]|nr:SMC-Scp complex subunit ScpB [Anaeromyxobacter sp.]MBL0277938.1 SMC-Scp complex subunit ScpB [Anaeromyxobacter sp.]
MSDPQETAEQAAAAEPGQPETPGEAVPEVVPPVEAAVAGAPTEQQAGAQGGPGTEEAPAEPDVPAEPAEAPAAAEAPAGPRAARRRAAVSPEELQALQAAEDAKSDPALDEVEPADIEVADDKEEPFEKLVGAARRLSPDRVRTVVETLLFLAERPLLVEEIHRATGVDAPRIEKALDKLTGHYREGPCGVVLHEVAGGWQLRSSPDNSTFARRFLKVKPQRLTRAALESLAIIAYRQPVTRPEVEEIRGVDCGAVVKALLERKLIKILGKKEEPGRPILYGTSREFLEFFALKDLASLPTLREFAELSVEHREIVEKQEEAPLAGLVDELTEARPQAELDARRAESDAALEELEAALAKADGATRAAEAALDQKPAGSADEEGAP